MKTNRTAAIVLTAGMLAATPALADFHGNDLVHARKFKGIVYTMNAVHMALYTYDGDEPNTSNCYDECAAQWPPALLPQGSKLGENYTLIKRRDGTMQIAYKGRPLYRYAGDKNVGDMNGDGIGGVWHLSRP